MDRLVQVLAFPSSALLAAIFLLAAFALHRYYGERRGVKLLANLRTARILLGVGAVLLGIEGTWAIPIHTTVAFAIYALTLMLSLALVVMQGIRRKAKMGFLLNHAGILLIVWASFFGAPDVTKAKMAVFDDVPTNTAYTTSKLAIPLPFHAQLREFRVDYYDDGVSPKQFTSRLDIDGKELTTSVNNPCTYGGYTIYQDSYDRQYGRYSVLLLVRDPWLPLVYLGMVLLAIGSVMLLFGKWKAKITIPITLLLTVAFTGLTVAKINFGTLMPALRSWWFVPHLFIYMVAYSLMALALLVWVAERRMKSDALDGISDRLVRSSSALLIIGMLTGSVWARQAWGDYWAWDPKENWAAATWLLTLMHLHCHRHPMWKPIVVLILAFLALQITWYGVNYLPSAMQSMHTYMN